MYYRFCFPLFHRLRNQGWKERSVFKYTNHEWNGLKIRTVWFQSQLFLLEQQRVGRLESLEIISPLNVLGENSSPMQTVSSLEVWLLKFLTSCMIWKFLARLWVFSESSLFLESTFCILDFLISLPTSHMIPVYLPSHCWILWNEM